MFTLHTTPSYNNYPHGLSTTNSCNPVADGPRYRGSYTFINLPEHLANSGVHDLALVFLYILPFSFLVYIAHYWGREMLYMLLVWRHAPYIVRSEPLEYIHYHITHVVIVTWRDASKISQPININKPNMAFNETENHIQPQSKKISLIMDVLCI